MDNIYLFMIIALAILAVADLVVGVSNDAVNFLNSAVGSKAVSIKTIMIVASIGIALGAIFSSGMMEVARKGIFNPEMFMFSDLMIIFMAVMITDILLLDFFNTIGMPTSTTVSIVFELLGAAVAIALVKIAMGSGDFSTITSYINTSQATEIVSGILLSVLISFSVGTVVMYFARLLLTFNYGSKAIWVGAVFGGLALTSIIYFILLKGIGGTEFEKIQVPFTGGVAVKDFMKTNTMIIVGVNLALWSTVSFLAVKFLKANIYKIVIIAGTFALALAFAGNDLVNFIGVPIAAWQSYEAWVVSGVPADQFGMSFLADKVATPTLLLFISGIVMVLTLWFSKKAKYVAQTEINLSREGGSKERFEPNFLSRIIVRSTKAVSFYLESVTPKFIQEKIEERFEKPEVPTNNVKNVDLPAFDLVRAAVNLMIAGVLISIATSYKLPLSTTYVTFMVAMGTSLADRAWGSESAVYRVAGVLNVIGGWFFTAIIAFVAAATVAYLIHVGGPIMIGVLLLLAVLIIFRNSMNYIKKSKEENSEDSLNNAESDSIQGVMEETAKNISKVFKRVDKIQSNTIEGLIKQDLKTLKKAKSAVVKLEVEIEDLQNNIFYFIKNLHESSVNASSFYLDVVKSLQDVAQSVGFISKISYKHINNNHKALKENQANELKEIETKLSKMFAKMQLVFDAHSFNQIPHLIVELEKLLAEVGIYTHKQVERTRTTESSPKNTTLYFSILLEIEDLIKAKITLLESYTKI